MTPFPALHATLRAETGAHHARLEGTPYVSALRAGTLPALAALSFLRGLALVHAESVVPAVERALAFASALLEPKDDAFALVGVLYVLEGFRTGLQAERERLGGEACLSVRIDAFEPRLRACTGFTVADAARLITSPWVDERSGIEGALGATQGWFEDPHRFSPEWISEVRRLRASLDAGC